MWTHCLAVVIRMRAMSNHLKQTIQNLAQSFAAELVRAVRGAPLGELADFSSSGGGGGSPAKAPAVKASGSRAKATTGGGAGGGAGGGGRGRKGADVEGTVAQILSLLSSEKGGLRQEEIRGRLGLTKPQILRPIALALAGKRIRKTGQRRATRYFAK